MEFCKLESIYKKTLELSFHFSMNYNCEGIYSIICINFKKFVNNIKEAFQYANIIAPTKSVFIETTI